MKLILQGTDLKGTKAQLTTDPIQKKAQTSLLARRATPSPSEACDISEFSGFILSPLGHHNHYKYRHFSHENGQTKTDRNPGIETLETSSENSEERNPEGRSSTPKLPPPNSIRYQEWSVPSTSQLSCKQVCASLLFYAFNR